MVVQRLRFGENELDRETDDRAGFAGCFRLLLASVLDQLDGKGRNERNKGTKEGRRKERKDRQTE